MRNDRMDQFLRDAEGACEDLQRTLFRLERQPGKRDLVHEAFRIVHSLKSESQFLRLEELSAITHEMEGILEQIRQGTVPVDSETLGYLYPMIDEIESRLAPLSELVTKDGADGESDGLSEAADGEIPGRGEVSREVEFTDFELELIREARARGERLYRISCEIEESAPLKYPRAYLVVNNLELVTNVIKSVPTFDEANDEAFHLFDVYFATGLKEGEIRKSVDVDQVEVVRFTEVPFPEGEEASPPTVRPVAGTTARRGPSTVRVENGRLDAIRLQLKVMRTAVQELRRLGARQTMTLEMENRIRRLGVTIRAVDRLVNGAREVPISEELQGMPALVEELATRLGKQVRLTVDGESVTVDRRLLAMLSEPLVHLVRNAVDHGIERPEERIASGKDPVGTVLISIAARDGELRVTVGDDGRGISEVRVRRRADELGIRAKGGPSGSAPAREGNTHGRLSATGAAEALLDLLVRPGFSTRREATAFSGRGVGLDAIYQKVRQSLGGELHLESREGRGTRFTISIPGAGSMLSLMVVRSGQTRIGIPLRDIESVADARPSAFSVTQDGSLKFNSLPVRNLSGRPASDGSIGAARHVVVLGRGKAKMGLLCDELLFERNVPEARLAVTGDAEDGLMRVSIGDAEADFFLLTTSVPA